MVRWEEMEPTGMARMVLLAVYEGAFRIVYALDESGDVTLQSRSVQLVR